MPYWYLWVPCTRYITRTAAIPVSTTAVCENTPELSVCSSDIRSHASSLSISRGKTSRTGLCRSWYTSMLSLLMLLLLLLMLLLLLLLLLLTNDDDDHAGAGACWCCCCPLLPSACPAQDSRKAASGRAGGRAGGCLELVLLCTTAVCMLKRTFSKGARSRTPI